MCDVLALIASLGYATKCLRLDWGNYLTVMGYIFFTALSVSASFYIQQDKRDKRQKRDRLTREIRLQIHALIILLSKMSRIFTDFQ